MRYFLACIASAMLALAGCAETVQGVDQAAKTALAIDAAGCPDLSGTYAFSVPDEKGVSYRNSMLEKQVIDQEHGVLPSDISGLRIDRIASGAFQFRFIIDDTSVAKEVLVIREFDKPRYRDWYHLQHEPARSADIAHQGEAAHVTQINALGPTTEIVRELRAGADVACHNGWLELPRGDYSAPIRLTLGEDGSILGTSREVSTFEVSVWCGDGCKYLGIPTGVYTGTLRWPRDDGQQPWHPDLQRVERPIDEIEAERVASEAAQQVADDAHYLPVNQIRARIQALAPNGSVLDQVEVHDGKVWLSYTAPKDSAENLLQRITAAGAETINGGPQAVRRIVDSSRMDELTVEFELTESPLVLRDGSNRLTAGASPIVGAVEDAAMKAHAPAQVVPVDAPPGPVVAVGADANQQSAMPAKVVKPSSLPPVGYADAVEMKRRITALFASGCHINAVGYDSNSVIVGGHADSHQCVSDGLRALDRAGGRPELLDIVGSTDGGYTFRISLGSSDLTRL